MASKLLTCHMIHMIDKNLARTIKTNPTRKSVLDLIEQAHVGHDDVAQSFSTREFKAKLVFKIQLVSHDYLMSQNNDNNFY